MRGSRHRKKFSRRLFVNLSEEELLVTSASSTTSNGPCRAFEPAVKKQGLGGDSRSKENTQGVAGIELS